MSNQLWPLEGSAKHGWHLHSTDLDCLVCHQALAAVPLLQSQLLAFWEPRGLYPNPLCSAKLEASLLPKEPFSSFSDSSEV